MCAPGGCLQALLHCPHLSTLTMSDNPELETIMIWSDDLTHLDLSGCHSIINLKLHCPNLVDQRVPPLKFIEKHIKPSHPPIASVLKVSILAKRVRGLAVGTLLAPCCCCCWHPVSTCCCCCGTCCCSCGTCCCSCGTCCCWHPGPGTGCRSTVGNWCSIKYKNITNTATKNTNTDTNNNCLFC